VPGDLGLRRRREGELVARQVVGERRPLTDVDGRLPLLGEQWLADVLAVALVAGLVVDHSDHLLERGDEVVRSPRVQVGHAHLQEVVADDVDREPLLRYVLGDRRGRLVDADDELPDVVAVVDRRDRAVQPVDPVGERGRLADAVVREVDEPVSPRGARPTPGWCRCWRSPAPSGCAVRASGA